MKDADLIEALTDRAEAIKLCSRSGGSYMAYDDTANMLENAASRLRSLTQPGAGIEPSEEALRVLMACGVAWRDTGKVINAMSCAYAIDAPRIAAAERARMLGDLKSADAALAPLADAVFNDNGDLTVSAVYPTSEQCIAAYFARKAIRKAGE